MMWECDTSHIITFPNIWIQKQSGQTQTNRHAEKWASLVFVCVWHFSHHHIPEHLDTNTERTDTDKQARREMRALSWCACVYLNSVPRHKHCRPHQWSAADWAFPRARSGLGHSSFFPFPHMWVHYTWQALLVRIRIFVRVLAGVCMLSFGCLYGHKRVILRFEFWLCVLLPSSCTNAIWISTLHHENGMRNRAGWYTNRLQQRRISASVVWEQSQKLLKARASKSMYHTYTNVSHVHTMYHTYTHSHKHSHTQHTHTQILF